VTEIEVEKSGSAIDMGHFHIPITLTMAGVSPTLNPSQLKIMFGIPIKLKDIQNGMLDN